MICVNICNECYHSDYRHFEYGNDIQRVGAYAFDGLPTGVKTMSLRGQPRLSELSQFSFSSMSQKHSFDIIGLRCNRLQTLGDHVFDNIVLAKELNLRFNELSTDV